MSEPTATEPTAELATQVQQSLPDTRISKDITNEKMYPIFHEAVTTLPFLTTDSRRVIISGWKEFLPNISENALRIHLSRMERDFYNNQEVMDREGLRNRILAQQQHMNNELITSGASIDKIARGIVESNKLIASVAQLGDMAPSIEIKIETNAPSDLSIRMNKSITNV